MPLERQIGEDEDVFQKIVNISGDKALDVFERVVIADTSDGAITVTLPPVGEAVGKIFTIHAPTAGTDGNAVTLEDKNNDSVNWPGDFTLDADNDRIALISDGRAWWVLDNQIA